MNYESKFLEQILKNHPEMDLDEAQALAYRTEQKRQRLVRQSGKTCPLCHEFKRISEYSTDAENEDALEVICKVCKKTGTETKNETVDIATESDSFPDVALIYIRDENTGVTQIPYDPTAQQLFSTKRWWDGGNRLL